jgi:hypothetical protein
MKPGRTLGFVAVFVGGLLATLTSAHANHFIAGGGRYSLTAETSVRFQFLGVASSLSPKFVPVIPTQIQCTVVHAGGDTSFRLFMSGRELDPFTVIEIKGSAHRITITGTMRSQLIWGEGADRQRFIETAPFEAVGVDAAIPGAGRDSFALTIRYEESGDIGPLLSEALGAERVPCSAGTCTLTVTGTLEDGEIEGHTAGGQ